jgi:hypothetical protein
MTADAAATIRTDLDPGDVDRGDSPAATGEPKGVGAFTASDVECPARWQVDDAGTAACADEPC